jgi:pimeloyl-ACP methyl ester carboxylesterase
MALLLALFYIGGGWYFSGRIESGALASTPGPQVPTYDLAVVAVDDGSVTYTSVGDPAPSFDQESNYALLWDGGWAHVGPPSSTADGAVTRPVVDATGTPLAVGTLAALERDWFIGDPRTALGLAFEDVVVTSVHGQLPAWYVPAEQPSSWTAVMVHGRDGFRRETLRSMKIAHEAGFNVLAITYLGDYGNTPYPDGHLGFGATEWPDVEAAVTWAESRGTTDVVLMGNSMGTTVVAAFLKESDSARVVRGVVLDSAAIDLGQTVEAGAAEVRLPVLGAPPASLVAVAEWFAGVRYGVDWDYLDYTDDVMWDSIPTLALHGTDDPTVTVQVSRDFAALHPDTVQFEEFAGAQHVESWNTDRIRYERVVGDFLEQVARGEDTAAR